MEAREGITSIVSRYRIHSFVREEDIESGKRESLTRSLSGIASVRPAVRALFNPRSRIKSELRVPWREKRKRRALEHEISARDDRAISASHVFTLAVKPRCVP